MKASRYNHILYSGEYGYWYNALSGCYFRLSNQLSRKAENLLSDLDLLENIAKPLYNKLLTSGFILSSEIDELDEVRRKHYAAVHSKEYFLVILPTLNCNFTCWYCIQDHVHSIMSQSTFEAIKKHIDYMIKEKGITSLHLDWFGGEPFMFFRKIIKPLSLYAIEKCQLFNIPFINTSTTNGYFINEEVARDLSDLRFTQFQITLDGEKMFHDRVKFMKGCPSAFEHVLRNINNLLTLNTSAKVYLRINYTHTTLTRGIVNEVNEFISEANRLRVVITPKKVWQETVDKNFGPILQEILDDFEKYGYLVARGGISRSFTSCYVNREYYNAINYNGNVVKCTACDDIHKEHTKGKLLDNGQIVWEDNYDVQCQSSTFENDRCRQCNKLPLCMGLCPRDSMNGLTHCKYDVIDDVFEDDLLDYLTHKYN